MIASEPTTFSTKTNDPADFVDTKLEVVVIPVSDVDRAAEFYVGKLGWRVDLDLRTEDGRVLHVTPRGSAVSIMFGTGLTPSAPGSTQFLHLIVSDIEAADAQLRSSGIETSGIFHDPSGYFNRFDPRVRVAGPDPDRGSYASFAAFNDPDGNGWMLQEVTSRFPGRIDSDSTTFASENDLASAVARAEAAFARRAGGDTVERAQWTAKYLVAEQSGAQLPN